MIQKNDFMKKALSGILILGVATLATTYFIINYNGSGNNQNGEKKAKLTFPYPDSSNKQQIALGQSLYNNQCASCHGENLEGEPNWRSPLADGSLPAPPHDENGHTWHHPDSVLFRITKYGGASVAPEGFNSRMPAFEETLSDEDISATLAFIKSKWPKNIRMRQQQITEKSNYTNAPNIDPS